MDNNKTLPKIYLKMRMSSIFPLKNILEGFDNQYILTTLDTQMGTVSISYTQGSLPELMEILESLRDVIAHEIIS